MFLHDLKSSRGAKKDRIRKGRGNASKGTFCGRGCKGQNARTGGGVRPGFEGGQTPLYRRMPKRAGFFRLGRRAFTPVNLGVLNEKFSAGAMVDKEALQKIGLLKNARQLVKILGDGELKIKLTVVADRVSATAREKIEKAGGTIQELKTKNIKGMNLRASPEPL